MTGSGASDGDMPIFPWSAPGDVPPIGDAAFDALLAGELPPEAATGLRPVAEMIAALNGTPLTSELASEATVLAVFRSEVGRSGEPVRPRRKRHPVLTTLLGAKPAAAAAAAAVILGAGATVAAYAGVLPAPVQRFAHDTLGAPPSHPAAHPSQPATPTGPGAAGHAAYGLCTAYSRVQAHGSATQKAVAFRKLAAAAGGAANVTAYCARVAHPGTTPTSHPTGGPTSHPTSGPTSHPSGKPTSHPTGKPTSHPSGKPTSHPTGKPTSHPTGKAASTP